MALARNALHSRSFGQLRRRIYINTFAYPNLLGFLLLDPPNFNLVASMTLTILLLNALPSLPNMIFVSASLPGPKSLKTTSKCRICPPFP